MTTGLHMPAVSPVISSFPVQVCHHLQKIHASPRQILPLYISLKPLRSQSIASPKSFRLSAQSSNSNGDANDTGGGAVKETGDGGNVAEVAAEKDPKRDRGNGAPAAMPFPLRWGDLLKPDPENLAAVGLVGLLAWASAQVVFQLFFISLAILLAALKYSFIAALLLFILITLL